MKFYLVEVAVLLAVTSFIFCTGDTESSTASGESGSTEPKQPVFCSASSDDQKNIFDCTQKEINNSTEAQEALKNYTLILCGDFDTFYTSICNNTNKHLIEMTEEEQKSLFDLVLKCETKHGVTLPPTSTPPAC
ncbi:secreted salivary gland peptide, putative [Ixodes scapularis]|uniref:Secreted salivary gland peptide, putative n=1 Tax=Ixodes scapularis TaxID=6945 RepID=B7QM44_IXOSC|nr:secreted salivary gland peptide, putative [Ixodes scapularis]|eukprot:XP_002416249.1 secreted salivary gland peptide, putative [Ixodes scapularis]